MSGAGVLQKGVRGKPEVSCCSREGQTGAAACDKMASECGRERRSRRLKDRLQRLCACTAPPGRAQKLRNCKDFVLVLLHRGGPRSSAIAKTLCLYCSTGAGPETPQSSWKLPRSSRKLPEAPLAQALCLYCSIGEGPEAPPLERLCASTASPGSAQECTNAQCSQCSQKLAPVLVGKNYSARSAHIK